MSFGFINQIPEAIQDLPENDSGQNNDVIIDRPNGIIYVKQDGAWAEVFNQAMPPIGPALIETTPDGHAQDFGVFTYGDIPGVTELVLNHLTSVGGINIEYTNSVTSISMPNVTEIDADNIQGGQVYVVGNAALIGVHLPLLQSTGGNLHIRENPVLSEIDLSSFIPTNGQSLECHTNALLDTTVNLILARCVAASGYVSGEVRLDGVSNAAPTGQGLLDVIELQNRGVTVNVNP